MNFKNYVAFFQQLSAPKSVMILEYFPAEEIALKSLRNRIFCIYLNSTNLSLTDKLSNTLLSANIENVHIILFRPYECNKTQYAKPHT